MASHDASIFPDWEPLRNVAGWYEFRHANRRVLIKNIDFSPDETNTGGDLVYIRQQPDAAIFVQYKRLTEPTRAVKGWTFRDDGRLRQQLDRLIMESGKLMPASLPLSGHTDYRLNDQTGFLKFVDARPVASDGLSPLAGCYLPAEYARAVLHELEDDRGRLPPMDPRKVRCLDSQTFVRLVADGWIGSCSPGTKAIAARMLPMLRDERTGEVTYVFDDPAARSA